MDLNEKEFGLKKINVSAPGQSCIRPIGNSSFFDLGHHLIEPGACGVIPE